MYWSTRRLAAEAVGLKLDERQMRNLPEQWRSLPVFPDVEEALTQLRAMGCKIAVLTNCDDDLFAQTQQSFRLAFDRVVTAEQVGDYKPSLSHFRGFEEALRVDRTDWVHVASSWFHDLTPAHELGIKHIWLNREQTSEQRSKERVRVLSPEELPAVVRELLEKSR